MPIITLKGAPASTPTTPEVSSRQRAIAKFNEAAQAQQHPVRNPSQVAPEDMTALAPSIQADETSRQFDTSEDPASEAAPQEATPPKTEEQPPLSSQYAQLARKEKAIRAKAQEIRAKEDALKAREDAVKAKESSPSTPSIPPTQALKDRLAKGPHEKLAVLNELGLSYEEITNLMLNQPSPESTQLHGIVDELRSEIRALKGDQEDSKKSYAEQQQRAYNQAVTQIKNEAQQLVTNSPEFETIRETNSVPDVVELIEETFKQDGILLSVEEACQAVEDHLVEEATKLAKLKKIQARLAPTPSATPKLQDPAKQSQMKTLTNAVSTSKPMTAKERAILAFNNQLK